MRTGLILASAEPDGAKRALTCPLCARVHVWVITDVGAVKRSDDWRSSLGSSVE